MAMIGAAAMGLMIFFYIYVLVQFNRELRSVRKARSRLTPWPPLMVRSATRSTMPLAASEKSIVASSGKSNIVVLQPAKSAFTARPRATRAKGSS